MYKYQEIYKIIKHKTFLYQRKYLQTNVIFLLHLYNK